KISLESYQNSLHFKYQKKKVEETSMIAVQSPTK
ncbi:hypothetical protein SMU80_07659, partial [Streptococcus mutans SF1]